MDRQGNEKKRIYLPVPENYGLESTFHVIISDNYFYKLEENPFKKKEIPINSIAWALLVAGQDITT